MTAGRPIPSTHPARHAPHPRGGGHHPRADGTRRGVRGGDRRGAGALPLRLRRPARCPWDDQLARPFDLGDVDLQGPPRNALHVRMLSENVLCIDEDRDGVAITPHHLESGCASWVPYEEWLTPDAARRDIVEIRVSDTQVSVGIPDHDRTFHVWTPPSPIPWRQGIVQLGHHSYTPTKDGAGAPHMWHWDDLEIDPALPFRMIGAVGGPHAFVRSAADIPCDDDCTVAFEHPAPADAQLRFVAWGAVDLDVGDG